MRKIALLTVTMVVVFVLISCSPAPAMDIDLDPENVRGKLGMDEDELARDVTLSKFSYKFDDGDKLERYEKNIIYNGGNAFLRTCLVSPEKQCDKGQKNHLQTGV